jgi:hypothetical protein
MNDDASASSMWRAGHIQVERAAKKDERGGVISAVSGAPGRRHSIHMPDNEMCPVAWAGLPIPSDAEIATGHCDRHISEAHVQRPEWPTQFQRREDRPGLIND